MNVRVLLLCALLSAGLLGPAEARERQGRFDGRGNDSAQSDDDRRDRGRKRGADEDRQDRPNRSDDGRGGERAAAAREAQARNGGGRVLSVDPEDGGYRVKVLKNGEVRTHHVERD